MNAWAIFVNDRLALFDSRCPIFWLKKVAKRTAEERGLQNAEIRKVKVGIGGT